MSLKRKQPTEDAPQSDTADDICRSSPLEDRSSTFIAYFSPTLKPKELQAMAEFESASHKMLAWRKKSNQQSITKAVQYVTGSDDDGEKYGGKRIERVLDALKVEGACVVARWYGGVLLGPVRFTHIEEVTKEAIRNWQEQEAERSAKKRKLEEDEADHARLSKSLGERDQSIVVLRELAAKKEQELKQAKEGGANVEEKESSAMPSSAPQATTDYTTMPVDRLRALDKARDATISFLLKRIDKAEADLASYQKSETADTEPP